MDIAYEVARYLQTAGFGTLLTDIFVGQAEDNKNCVWVERIGGTPNNYVPIDEAVVNIFVKNTDGSEAVVKLDAIKRHIHRMHNTVTANSYIYSFLVLGDIEDVQRDLEYAKIFKLTVQVVHRATAVIS